MSATLGSNQLCLGWQDKNTATTHIHRKSADIAGILDNVVIIILKFINIVYLYYAVFVVIRIGCSDAMLAITCTELSDCKCTNY